MVLRLKLSHIPVLFGFLFLTNVSYAQNEIALFDGAGRPVAYVATDRDMTIYLWNGKPVAYLVSDSSGGFHVYGFNGQHLGWFVRGVIWDQTGDASCAVKEALHVTAIEPVKDVKEVKPVKSVKEIAPVRPVFSNSFGDISCQFLLAAGGE